MRTTRRDFLSKVAALSTVAAMRRTALAQAHSLEQRLAADPERPQFHLLPAKNWMNDPNGPIYCNGMYHMFFQYDPDSPVWGDMSWNHAISADMLHWNHMPLAFEPTPGSPDSFGCFSGSAIAVGQRVYAAYTGTRHSNSDTATIRDGANNVQESQCLAWSDDPNLKHWTKDPANPVIPVPPPGLAITGFRDPSMWRQGAWYYMTIGSGIAKQGGCVLLYRSHNLHQWEYLHELTSGEWNHKPTANPCNDGEMWECPEFFSLDGGHVLIYSTLGKVFWQSGVLDESTMRFRAQKTGLLDLGAFYAPKTQLDAEGRRILWGWIPERRSEQAMREAGWSGMMSLPRVMNLDQDGVLRLGILPQTSSLRKEMIPVSESSSGRVAVVAQATGEVRCIAPRGTSFDLAFSMGGQDIARVRYSAEKHALVTGDQEIRLQPADIPQVHGFIDGSVIELILGGRVGDTQRFYYPGHTAPDIRVSVMAPQKLPVTLHAWAVRPISPNRLTTPA
jgi:beta-fructofuranosidase